LAFGLLSRNKLMITIIYLSTKIENGYIIDIKLFEK